MSDNPYFQHQEVFEKTGNVIRFFAEKIPDLYITKLSKLLYILDELAVQEIGMPVTGLDYKVAKMGPLAATVWTSLNYNTGDFDSFVSVAKGNAWVRISPRASSVFNDSLFTEFEMELLEKVVIDFGAKKTEELIDFTHREGYPWSIATKTHDINFDKVDDPNVTEFIIDFSSLLDTEIKKINFQNYLASMKF